MPLLTASTPRKTRTSLLASAPPPPSSPLAFLLSLAPPPSVSSPLLLLLEALLLPLIISRVAYTEIDWRAYMQEVAGYVGGERDYRELRGDTGPLVYPAGFLYVYRVLRSACGGDGSDVRLAQHIFAGVYLLNAAVLHRVYRLCLAPEPSPSSNFLYLAAISLLSLSKRLHSIYVLRCFNDTVSTLLLNASLLLFLTPMKHRNHAASLAYSLSVSVKMNTLLYAPAVLLHYLQVRRPPPLPAPQVHL